MKVAIVGGGVSGAAAARFLAEAGVQVDVFERDALAGGLMRSELVSGYSFDVSGGHILYSTNEWYNSFIAGIFREDELVTSRRNTKILLDGRLVHYPFENGLADLDPEERLRCVVGYIRAWAAREAGARVPDNFHDWIHYRFGEGICRAFMLPYNEKIWKADLRELGVDWVEGRVPAAPLEDVIRSGLGARTEGYTHQIAFRYPLCGGFQTIFDRIAAPIRDRIHTGVAVRRIERRGKRFAVDGNLYDRVISTMPLPELAEVLADWDSAAREAARALQHRSVTSVLFGIDAESVRPISWLYVPHAAQGPCNRVTYLSNYSPRNAPLGRGSIQAEVTHAGPLALDDGFLDGLRQRFHELGLLRRERVDVMHHHCNEWGYILFDRDFTRKRRLAVEGAERSGVLPLGRFGRFDYHNSDQCVVAAKALVERLLAEEGGA
ncbi:MAG: FAD-dependent oxidoreductase [Planctomycetes bacterium]|nr:FAD-dependent oxidoreductase [Planctomycetota bacterium]